MLPPLPALLPRYPSHDSEIIGNLVLGGNLGDTDGDFDTTIFDMVPTTSDHVSLLAGPQENSHALLDSNFLGMGPEEVNSEFDFKLVLPTNR